MSTELTVASFNLHWGRGLRWLGYQPFDVVAACERLDADLLVLQESWAPDDGPAQHELVAEALGCTFVAQPLARAVAEPHPAVVDRADPEHSRGHDRGTGDWCLAVLSRLPIESSGVTHLPQLRTDPSSRAVLRAQVRVDGRPLTVHGTHLPHLQMGSPFIRRPLRDALAPHDEAAVLIGDMNMWSWCMSLMAPARWRRVGRGRTFPSPYPHSRIDHLVASPSVEVRWTEVVAERSSDHRPIRAGIALRERS